MAIDDKPEPAFSTPATVRAPGVVHVPHRIILGGMYTLSARHGLSGVVNAGCRKPLHIAVRAASAYHLTGFRELYLSEIGRK